MPNMFESIFGKKPTVPKLPPVDLTEEQNKAIAGNLSVLPQAENLANQTNAFNRQQVKDMLKAAGIDYDALSGQIGKNIESQLRGEIPSDVSAAVGRSDAARALGSGYAGTPMARNLTARDLGLVSLDLTGRGLASTESWLNAAQRLFSPGELNVASMFVSPQQRAQFDVEERNTQFQRRWMQEQIHAMPNPTARGIYDMIGEILGVFGVKHQSANPQQAYSQAGAGFGGGGGSYGPGGYSTAPMEGYGGYDYMSYMDSMGMGAGAGAGADFGGEMSMGAALL